MSPDHEHEHVHPRPTRAPAPVAAHGPAPAHPVLDLQAVAGNAAVAGLLAGRPAGPGAALPPAARARLEAAFGLPLGHVRVHSGDDAGGAARGLGARAFTVGDHIALPANGPSVESPAGYRMLAHEVTHVVQQRGRRDGAGVPRRTRRGEPLEAEAGAVADRMAAGGPAGPVSDSGGPVLARDESGPWAVTEWLGDKAKAGKEAAYGWLIGQLRDLHRSGIARLRGYGERWEGTRRAIWDGIVDAADVTMTILEGLVYAVVGIVAGFVTGILQMVLGLLKMIVGVFEGILSLLYGVVDKGERFETWADGLATTIKAIPAGLKMLVTDWLAEFHTASPERSALMIGELTGQILAFVATLGVSAGKAGTLAQSAKLGPRLAKLTTLVPRGMVASTGDTMLVWAAEASPQAVATTTKAVGTVAAATEQVGPTVLAMASHGSTGGGSTGGGGTGGSAPQPSKPPVRESAGASPPGTRRATDPFTGQEGDVVATSKTPRSQRTGIDASGAEFESYNTAVHQQGEIGLQRPGNVNQGGPDFITAARNPQGQMEIVVNDATVNVAKQPKTTLPKKWNAEVADAVSPNRLKLGNPQLEKEIQDAYKAGRVRIRTQHVEKTPAGQVTLTDR